MLFELQDLVPSTLTIDFLQISEQKNKKRGGGRFLRLQEEALTQPSMVLGMNLCVKLNLYCCLLRKLIKFFLNQLICHVGWGYKDINGEGCKLFTALSNIIIIFWTTGTLAVLKSIYCRLRGSAWYWILKLSFRWGKLLSSDTKRSYQSCTCAFLFYCWAFLEVHMTLLLKPNLLWFHSFFYLVLWWFSYLQFLCEQGLWQRLLKLGATDDPLSSFEYGTILGMLCQD